MTGARRTEHEGRRRAGRGVARHGVQRAQPAGAGQRPAPGGGCWPRSPTLGFVRNESARQLRGRRQPHAGLRRARHGQPVLHRRGRGRRRRPPTRPGSRCSCATAASDPTREAAYLDLLEQQRVRGRADHPGRPGRPAARPRWPGAARRSCVVDRAAGPEPLLGDRRRRRSAATSPRPTCSTWATAGSPSSAARAAIGQVADRIDRRAERARPGRRRAADRAGDRGARPSPRAAAPASGSPACPPPAGPTAAFCANDLLALGLLQQMVRLGPAGARGRRHRRLRRHRVRRGRRGPADLGGPAAAPARADRGRAAAVESRATPPTTPTSRWCSPRSWWCGRPPGCGR